MAFQRKTLRNLTPLAREVAEAINECDRVERRLKRLLEAIMPMELDASALRYKFPELATDPRKAWDGIAKGKHNLGRYTLAELDESFHYPAPLERKVLGE